MYATANGFATLALNRDKVGAFVKSSRVVYKGWLHGYERAARVTSAKLVATAAGAAKSPLGPSLVYGCTMRAAAAAGLPSLVAVGGANVATPLIVSKMGGRLGALPAHALAARALPIAAHCVIEWGLFQRFKEHMVRANAAARGVPRSRAKKVVDGALTGGVCAAAATATTVLALTPWYGGKLFARAVAADSAATAARLGMAAVRVTKLRLADSLQQGVVWFSTYEGMRAAMAIYDEKAAEVVAAKELAFGFTVDGADAAVGTGADEAAEMDAAVDGGLEGVGAAAAAQEEGGEGGSPATPSARRFARRDGRTPGSVGMRRRAGERSEFAALSPRRKALGARFAEAA